MASNFDCLFAVRPHHFRRSTRAASTGGSECLVYTFESLSLCRCCSSGFVFQIATKAQSNVREAVSQLLGVYSDVVEAGCLTAARGELSRGEFDVVVLDKHLPDGDGIELLREIKSDYPNTAVIMLTSDADMGSIKYCVSRGADDYVIKTDNVVPDLLVRLPIAVSKAAATRRLASLEQLVKDTFRYEIVGKSQSTLELRETIQSLKGSQSHGYERQMRHLRSGFDIRQGPIDTDAG